MVLLPSHGRPLILSRAHLSDKAGPSRSLAAGRRRPMLCLLAALQCTRKGRPDLEHTKAERLFELFNACLARLTSHFCCFVCSEQFALTDCDHVQRCLMEYLKGCVSLAFNHIGTVSTPKKGIWIAATHFLCPIESCLDEDWHRSEKNAHMAPTSVVQPGRSERIPAGARRGQASRLRSHQQVLRPHSEAFLCCKSG